MGVLYTYFADRDDAAAAAVAESLGGPVAGEFAIVEGVDPTVQGGTLLSLLTERPYDDIVADDAWAHLVSAPDAESWVVSLPSSFTDALADATPERLAEVAVPWSQTEEFWGGADAADLVPMLLALRDLARSIRDADARLYCWMSL